MENIVKPHQHSLAGPLWNDKQKRKYNQPYVCDLLQILYNIDYKNVCKIFWSD